ncbi:hypothetical protein [Streptomyces sp. 3214.6]|uniref:hypothetical protein n=1 Tax=Streptomyces sp. 3214.6 TaxID=1882757 RepID=UPI00090B6271|nr:hypothetical protein [Streptomyces sp. 3214.6]SHH28869.1 hypothetical protein SAMN05444521_0007 [Streptomyces sp. 3214.6]
MSVYVATIEQDEHGQWTATADGLTGTGNGYTAARDALTDALFARDGEEPDLRRDRTEVPIPGRAERTPDRLLSLVAAELPDYAEKYARSLEQQARELDARDADALAVTAWCVETAGLIVTHRARPTAESVELVFVPWTKPDPRAGDDVFLSCWSPHELDDLPTLTKIADVPRTVLGILDSLSPDERVRAWQEMTTAEHGPALDRAMARWWHVAMVMGTAALQHTVEQSTKHLAAGHRGIPMTDLPASRALDDLHDDLTDEEQTARRKAWDRSQQEQTEARDAREDAYIADLERLLADAKQHRDMQREHQRRRQTVSDARSRIDTAAHEFRIGTGLFARLGDGLPITMHLPARPWHHVTASEPYHFVFTSKDGAQLARVTDVRHYDSIDAFDQAGEQAETVGTTPITRQEIESYPAQWGGTITLTATPAAEPVIHGI